MAIITISRGSLSGGRALAECLSARLGYPNVGREVLQEAAERMGISEESFRGRFETTPGIWARLTQAREKYILAIQTSLAEWCTRGELIYHGLAGQRLLQGLPGIFRVRLIAPLDKRVRALMENHPHMSRSQAESFIEGIDQDRARWVKVMYDQVVDDPHGYDLTINLRRHSIESACSAIAVAVAQPRFQITDEAEAAIFAFAADCRERLNRELGD